MPNDYDTLRSELQRIKQHAPASGAEKFFMSEALRFNSVAGTVLQSFPETQQDIDSRIITHILARSLFENYFWLLYIFDDPSTVSNRFDELLNDFKSQYNKLYNEPLLPHKDKLELPDASWASLPRPKDINSMLAAIKNNYGDRCNYLYFVYRITSFDTHGKSLEPLFDESFNKNCNFPVLDLPKAFDLIANQYLVIWQTICPAK
ncbi:DUF5677 domain-containing protein [Chlorobium sp. N1]|uniref:DUF5677 domain-containing protein n=1 Tax=Chlorobium sp. N1 TaxID=2491138 RepID=UPI00103C8CDE|nr:DUF5677 domain-containing protein [Chlorobium sp. N1]TCD46808.1 hypothetical protein E0L29_11385 [Chlorobium sp. N1]